MESFTDRMDNESEYSVTTNRYLLMYIYHCINTDYCLFEPGLKGHDMPIEDIATNEDAKVAIRSSVTPEVCMTHKIKVNTQRTRFFFFSFEILKKFLDFQNLVGYVEN